MKINIKDCLLVTDMDGTLLCKDFSISKKNRQAIENWISAGGKFTIATGRSVISAKKRFKDLPINCPIITFNGGMVFDLKTGKALTKHILGSNYKPLLDLVDKKYPEIGVELILEDKSLIWKNSDIIDEHARCESVPFRGRKDLPADVVKILFGVPKEMMDEFSEYVDSLLDDTMCWVRSAECYLEVLKAGVDKWHGVDFLKKHLTKAFSYIIVFGDYNNDIFMLKESDFGIAVENSPDDVKEAADFVTTTNENDAIYNGLKMLEKFIVKEDEK